MSIQNETAVRTPFWRRAAVFLFVWAYRLTGLAVITSAVVVLFAQTPMAREFLRSKLLDIVNGELQGTVTCDDVGLDIFRGITLEHPRLFAHGTTVLDADRISIAYDLTGLLGKTLAVNKVEILEPRVRVIRGLDSVWNVTRIVKPSQDTAASVPPDIVVRVRGVYIVRGSIDVDDRTFQQDSSNLFDPMHLRLRSVELRASLRLGLLSSDHTVSLNHLSFYDEVQKTLDVRSLTLDARLRPGDVDLRTLNLRLPHTSVNARARIVGVDVFQDGVTDSVLLRNPIVGRVEADSVWGPDLAYFIPDVVLADSYTLNANAVFSGSSLDVTGIDLRAGENRVRGALKVTGISDGHIGVDIRVNRSEASYADVRRRLVFVPLPELPFLKHTTIDSLHLRGRPEDSLWFEVHAHDRPGRVDGTMVLNLDNPVLGYTVDMRVREGDMSVFSDSTVATSLHGVVQCKGQGVTLHDLMGTYNLALDRSIIVGRPLRRGVVSITARGGGQISVDTLYADVTPFQQDTIDEYAITSDDRIVKGAVSLDLADLEHPRYNGSIDVNALNLASLFDSPSLPSRFSGVITVDGQGLELDSMLGAMDANVTEFALDDRALLPFRMLIESERRGNEQYVSVNAPFLHATVRGRYRPTALISAVSASVSNTMNAIQERIRHLYAEGSAVAHLGTAIPDLSAEIDITLKDASPLNIFLTNMSLSAAALIRGTINATGNTVDVDMDTVEVRDLLLRSADLDLSSDPLALSVDLRLTELSTSPRLERFVVHGHCDSTMYVNGTRIVNPDVFVATAIDTIRARAAARVNTVEAGVAFGGRFYEDSTELHVDSLVVIVDTARGLTWKALRPARMSVRHATLGVEDLSMQRDRSEMITVNGRFTTDRFYDARVQVSKFDLSDITRFVDLDKGHPVRFLSGFVRTCNVSVNGSWKQPVIGVNVDAADVSYNGERIGDLDAELRHKDQDVSGSIRLGDLSLDKPRITLDVAVRHLPLDLAIDSVSQRLVDGRPIDIGLVGNKVALAAVEPFLPAIERLHGVADATINVKGVTPDDIDLTGNARFRNASFLSSTTNIAYNADGVMHLTGSTLHLDTIIVRNLDRDRKKGIAYASGTVEFKGLSVDAMDFTVRSPGILVMNKSSQARSPKVFGDLIIAAGSKDSRPIRFHGKLDSPVLEGDLHVLYSDIVFPQERSTTKSRYTAFEYNRASDTSRKYNSVLDVTNPPQKLDSVAATSDVNRVAQAIEAVVKSTTASFVDILRYDLNVYLRGRTLLTMVFGTFEILIADLELDDVKIPLTFTGRFVDNSTNLRGKVRVKDGTSTYKFYKPFVASGTLDFTRGGMTDPSLDLKAVYRDRRPLADGRQEDFRVEVAITGTKQKPIARWSIYRQDRKQEGDSAKITGDALMLILLKKTQDELASSGQGNLVGEVNASLSALATSALGDLLSGIGGIVQSTQIDVGSDLSESRLTVSGQLWSDVSYRLTGQISDFAGNSTITITVPFTVLSDADAMRYFMLDASRSVNTTGNVTRYQRLWEVKLGARLP